jgi:hypothetical protein
MIKRLFIISIFTGLGQLFIVGSLKWLGQHGTHLQLTQLAQIDSLFQLIINLIALGLQPAAMRNIALADDWQKEYKATQTARITMGLILLPVSLLALKNPTYGIFIAAPLLALSGDYALYALNRSITATLFAFIRTIAPYCFIFMHYMGQGHWSIYAFIAGILFIYAVTDIFIARNLGIRLLAAPKWKSILLYVKSLPLGLVSLSLYFIGLGALLVVPYFYPESTTAAAFIGLKFYVIFKGVLRIIHQAFLKDMVNDEVCLRIDELSMIGGLSFLGSVLIFPDSFIGLFFGKSYVQYQGFFLLLGIAAVVYSFALSMATKAMLEKNDTSYTIVTCIAAFLSLIVIIIPSFYTSDVTCIGAGILAGELAFLAGLLLIMHRKGLIKDRMLFLIQSAPLLLIVFVLRYVWGDSIYLFLTSIGGFATLLLFLHRHKFTSLSVR